jgi:hypothetical protein
MENNKLFNIEFDKILNENYSFIKHLNLNDKISYKLLINNKSLINNLRNKENITFINKKELLNNNIIEFNSIEISPNVFINEITFIKKGIYKILLSRNYNYLYDLNDMEIIKYIVNIY